jgi:hypothetical protein
MKRMPVRLAVHSCCADAQPASSLDDPTGNFTTVSYKQLVNEPGLGIYQGGIGITAGSCA